MMASQENSVAPRGGRPPWRYIAIAIACGLLLPAVLAAIRTFPDAITGLWQSSRSQREKGEIEIYIGGNDSDEPRVMVINHRSAEHWRQEELKRREEIKRGKSYTWSSNDPLPGLRSRVKVVTHYPPDAEKSGLWVDGVKRPLTRPLTVIYTSDKLAAVEVDVGDEERDEFVRAAKGSDLFDFVAEWIEPRLSGAAGDGSSRPADPPDP
jgi:hypothetical protein